MARSADESLPTYDPPSANQLEISLFGPGYGECLIVHYRDGRWFTVDSCLEGDRETPSALAYLRRLGADPAKCVTHNVVTHPDGDHIGGLRKLFFECATARLVCPVILAEREMISYITLYAQTDPTPLTQTTRELYDVLELSTERTPKVPLYVKQDTLIVVEDGVTLTALSPADTKIKGFLGRVTQHVPREKSDRRASGLLRPNDVSAALLLEWNGFTAVFGADLEETPGNGWSTILNFSLALKKAVIPSIFKVAHHGSCNADCPKLWDRMKSPVAILAPFKRGSNKLPTQNDVYRILAQTDEAYTTSSFKTQPLKRLSRVDKILAQHGMRRRDLYPKNGHIRLRIGENGTVRLDLFESAVHLSRTH